MFTETKRDIKVPFCGFYESAIDALLNETIERELEALEIPSDYFWDVWSSNHTPVTTALSKVFLEALLEYIENETGVELSIDFVELVSPRFYNFETDKIYGKIDVDNVRKLVRKTSAGSLRSMIRERHTSCSGFISFYSNELAQGEWLKPVEEWDEIQLETLLLAFLYENDIEELDYFAIMENANSNGRVTECLYSSEPIANLLNKAYDNQQEVKKNVR